MTTISGCVSYWIEQPMHSAPLTLPAKGSHVGKTKAQGFACYLVEDPSWWFLCMGGSVSPIISGLIYSYRFSAARTFLRFVSPQKHARFLDKEFQYEQCRVSSWGGVCEACVKCQKPHGL